MEFLDEVEIYSEEAPSDELRCVQKPIGDRFQIGCQTLTLHKRTSATENKANNASTEICKSAKEDEKRVMPSPQREDDETEKSNTSTSTADPFSLTNLKLESFPKIKLGPIIIPVALHSAPFQTLIAGQMQGLNFQPLVTDAQKSLSNNDISNQPVYPLATDAPQSLSSGENANKQSAAASSATDIQQPQPESASMSLVLPKQAAIETVAPGVVREETLPLSVTDDSNAATTSVLGNRLRRRRTSTKFFEQQSTTGAKLPVVKRKRGRPRKYPVLKDKPEEKPKESSSDKSMPVKCAICDIMCNDSMTLVDHLYWQHSCYVCRV